MVFTQIQFILLLLALLGADLFVPFLIQIAPRFRALDRPHTYKSHVQAVPFVGGLGIFLPFALVLALTVKFETSLHMASLGDFLAVVGRHSAIRTFTGIVLGGALMLLMGIIDDYRPINAAVKLAILFLATFLLTELGVVLTLFGAWDWANRLLTLFWISGVISALNSFDNTDGAAGGASAISLIAVFAIAWGSPATGNQYWLSFVAATLLGGVLGFVRWNLPPARCYLGNGGAFSLGFMLGAISVLGAWSTAWHRALIVPFLLIGLPIYDIVICTWFRSRARVVRNVYQAIVYCGRDHVAHRLMALGLSKRRAVGVMYALQALLCATGWALVRYDRALSDARYFSVVAAVAGLFLLLSVALWRAPVYTRDEAPRAPCFKAAAPAASAAPPPDPDAPSAPPDARSSDS